MWRKSGSAPKRATHHTHFLNRDRVGQTTDPNGRCHSEMLDEILPGGIRAWVIQRSIGRMTEEGIEAGKRLKRKQPHTDGLDDKRVLFYEKVIKPVLEQNFPQKLLQEMSPR